MANKRRALTPLERLVGATFLIVALAQPPFIQFPAEYSDGSQRDVTISALQLTAGWIQQAAPGNPQVELGLQYLLLPGVWLRLARQQAVTCLLKKKPLPGECNPAALRDVAALLRQTDVTALTDVVSQKLVEQMQLLRTAATLVTIASVLAALRNSTSGIMIGCVLVDARQCVCMRRAHQAPRHPHQLFCTQLL